MSEPRCPYCLAALLGPSAGDAIVACVACGTEHHQACFLEHGRCTVLGCRAARFRAEPGAARVVGSLHPFLPVGPQRLRRSAGFLSVQPPSVERLRRRDLALRLSLAPAAVCGRALEGTLVVDAPEPVRGQGLRLRVETVIHGPRGPQRLRCEEAALVGGAARSWLERLRSWSGPRRALLLARGRTTFRFTLHPDALRWRGRLPEGPALGPRQTLVLVAELDADHPVRSEVCTIALLDGRPPPPALAGDEAGAVVDTLTLAAPPFDPSGPAAWAPCPVTTSRGGPAVAAGAVRRRRVRRGRPARADAIDLSLEPLAPGPPILRGLVQLALHARTQVGTVVLEVTAERRRPRDRAWAVYAREELVLAGPSSPGQDVAGRHALRFEYVPGPAFRARGRDRRRLRVRAALLFAGAPLRSRELEVTLAAPRGRRRTARPS